MKNRDYMPAIKYVENENGPVLGYSEESGVKLIKKDGYYFKDMAKDGTLHPYEDWRLPAEHRAKDLSEKLTIDQIAGLMLYSSHQMVPGVSTPYFGEVTYNGKQFSESGVPTYAISDQQKIFLEDNFLRHVLLMVAKSAKDAAIWNNNLQSYAEGLPWGIPVNTSSDPRHGTNVAFEFNAGAGGDISHWPEPLGLAASFNPELVRNFGEIASKEYRAMGITTALSPQIDAATEPRWWRFDGTFGESPQLSADMARAYCDGFQTSEGTAEICDGWGFDSVNAMVKHWPGGGSSEGGRDAHFGNGKYNVYPGDNFDEHMIPFTEGAFKLNGKTGKASAVMPYYSISFNQDKAYGENVGNSYSKYIITDLLRKGCSYDDVVCTDWSIIQNEDALDSMFTGKCWGVESLTPGERAYKAIEAGVDQFGGLNYKEPILAAYEIGVSEHGEEYMRARFQKSAERLLKNIFRLGLFENPYLDSGKSEKVVGCSEYMNAGFEAQKKSIVMLKNKKKVLPLAKKTKVYIPDVTHPEMKDLFRGASPARTEKCLSEELVSKYFNVVSSAKEADVALVYINAPGVLAGIGETGYSKEDRENGGNGYMPVSLQYRPYTAVNAREVSIAGGDPNEDFTNRSYKGKTTVTKNEYELDLVLDTKREMGDKPVIVIVKTGNPIVVKEFEPACDAILLEFGNLTQAALELVCGNDEPSGLLPMQLPADMETVELQFEDVPFDMVCYSDSEGNTYDFAFGMDFSGVIQDSRVLKYARKN